MSIITLSSQANTALFAQEKWNALGVAKRVALLQRFADQTPLASWVLERIATQMPEEVALPGPTGEANTLRWEGRGVAALLGDDTAHTQSLVGHLFAALATGNTVIVQSSLNHVKPLLNDLSTTLPSGVVQLVDAKADELAQVETFAAYAFSGSRENESNLNRALSVRGGALAQLISETDFDQFSSQSALDYPWRFVTESTLTVNTTAVGGNATLLELGGRSDH
jgi:delta 1-pyrroline-5-carboxylate dehydrogenase